MLEVAKLVVQGETRSQSCTASDRSQESATFTKSKLRTLEFNTGRTPSHKVIASILRIERIFKHHMSFFRALHCTALRRNAPFSAAFALARAMATVAIGDLNNTAAERIRVELEIDPAYRHLSLAPTSATDDPEVRSTYRPFIQDDASPSQDWVSQLELSTVLKMVDQQVLQGGQDRLKVLVVYGSMRKRYGLLPFLHVTAGTLTKTGPIHAFLHLRPVVFYFD